MINQELPGISSSSCKFNLFEADPKITIPIEPFFRNETLRKILVDGSITAEKLIVSTLGNKMPRRLVQIFIADPNENVPIQNSMLYQGSQIFTDLNDQELFFEIDINNILKFYNEARVKIVDKNIKERVEYLEPAKIRDLKMIVVIIASF